MSLTVICRAFGSGYDMLSVQMRSADRLVSWSTCSSHWQDKSDASYQGLYIFLICHIISLLRYRLSKYSVTVNQKNETPGYFLVLYGLIFKIRSLIDS